MLPEDPAFDFMRFCGGMKARSFVIYSGKQTAADSFRIGCIGQIDEHVMREVIDAIGQSLAGMGVASAAPSAMAMAEREKLHASAA